MSNEEEAIFRSADMILVQMYVANEIARETVSILGELGDIQFRDMNSTVNTFQRSFVKETRRYDETERQLRYLESIIHKQQVPIATTSFDELIQHSSRDLEELGTRHPQSSSEMDTLVSNVNQYEQTIHELADNFNDLSDRQSDLLEHRTVLQGTRSFFDARMSLDDDQFRISTDSIMTIDEEEQPMMDSRFVADQATPDTQAQPSVNIMGSTMSFISGTIDTDKYITLQRILWRVLRGNLYLNQVPIDEPIIDPSTGAKRYKCIFVVFTHGDTLMRRCRKVVESLDGKLYDVSPNYETYREELNAVNGKLEDLDTVLDATNERLVLELKEIALSIEKWKIEIAKEKAIYTTLNLFDYDQTRRCLIAEGWMPKNDMPAVKAALRNVTDRSGVEINTVINVIHTNRKPPTFFRTNKFTAAFQSIVDAYGIATYQEVNPGLPAIVTFPFMFAVMFGDMGHGFILFLAALSLVLNEYKIGLMKNRDEIFDMAYTGRYILLMMGFFSMYTGFMYNDAFSLSLTLFKSGWKWPSDFKEGQTIEATQRSVYPMGFDYAWHGAENNLLFSNSYKMKLSILLGYIHMLYSFQFSLVNYRFFKSRIDIIGNYIPGLLFLLSIFGYLCITIVYKWCVDWIAIGKPAPSLLNMLINMFLSPGFVDEQLYPGQSVIQVVLLLTALVCVPWMLLYKPLMLKKQNDRSIKLGYTDLNEASSSPSDEFSLTSSVSGAGSAETNFHVEDYDDEVEPFNFGDIMVNQVIHTIEFCLNSVSHTASYLRLWALSLAHGQLSSVLYEMTLKNGFVSYGEKGPLGCFILVFLFGMWFVLTVAILVLMEGTSAMLHSLRLHWVEAMSKHFEGDGYAYEPFAFYTVLTANEAT